MDIKNGVVECCKAVIAEADIDIDVDESTVISRECGIDSLGIVTLVLELEDKFGCDLDDYLAEIRRCHTVKDLIDLIENISA